jgi:CIC family chloride channel protein
VSLGAGFIVMTSFCQNIRFFISTVSIGLGAGLFAVGFQYGYAWIFQHTIKASSLLHFWLFVPLALCFMTGGALITGFLMQRFAQDAPGSGIPQVKAAYQSKHFDFSWNLLWVKFFGGILSLGTGSSMGREGPTIHIGAAIASKISGSYKESKGAQGDAICAGAAAGLAAAFNSPLAGVTLVLEVIAQSQNMDKYAGRSLLASAISVSMVYLFTADSASLPIHGNIFMKDNVLWLSPLVAIFAGLIGIFFQWMIFALKGWFKTSFFPLWLRPATGALVGGSLCLVAFAFTSRLGAFGPGEGDLSAALNNQVVWDAAIWLLGAKLLATICCFSAGGCGGIFGPLIFFGAMAGLIMFGAAEEWFQLDAQDQTMFSLIGMTACIGSVVRTPLTSILIVVEMSRQLHVLPALMIAAVTGVFMNRLFFQNSFYDESLKQDRIENI